MLEKSYLIEFIDIHGKKIKTRIDQHQAAHILQQLQADTLSLEEVDSRWDSTVFVRSVFQSTRQVPAAERLSDTEVLINRVWLIWQQHNPPLSLKLFKQRLLSCIEQGLIQAGCVVLLQTQNMGDLLESEIIDKTGNIYHFLKEPESN